MKELAGLIRVVRIFGWLSIIMGAMALLVLITTPAVGVNLRSISIVILAFLGGIVYLVIASGLSKRKKWAWYLGAIAFVYSAIHNFLLGSLGNIVAGIIAIAFLVVLLKERKAIFEQPRNPFDAS